LSRPPDSKSLEQIEAELQHCDGSGKRNLVIPYAGIPTPSRWQGRELLTYSRRKQIQFVITLSSQIAVWKDQLGKVVKAQLELNGPDARRPNLSVSSRVLYRTWTDSRASNWAETQLIREVGGFTAFLSGIRNNQLIEARLDDGQTTWKSVVSAQVLYLQLNQIED